MFVKKLGALGRTYPLCPPWIRPCAFLNDSVKSRTEVWSVGGHMSGVNVRSFVWQQLSAVAHAQGAGKQKVSSSLTDRAVLQQLIEQQDITVICTIHFHPWMHENHISAPAPGDTNWNNTQEHVYQKPVRDVNELKQRLTETWSATSRASVIKRLISGKIGLMRVLKPKANTEHLLWWEHPSGEVGILLQIYFSIGVPKIIKI